MSDSAAYTSEVIRTGHWPFAWGFVIRKDGEYVYGEKNIESRRAAQKDADDMATRLADGRNKIDPNTGVLFHA